MFVRSYSNVKRKVIKIQILSLGRFGFDKKQRTFEHGRARFDGHTNSPDIEQMNL